MDAGVGTEAEPARETATGCSASSEWATAVALALLALAARSALRRPVLAMQRAAAEPKHQS
jgi:hypothetical protein